MCLAMFAMKPDAYTVFACRIVLATIGAEQIFFTQVDCYSYFKYSYLIF